jgi:hypothetical protein
MELANREVAWKQLAFEVSGIGARIYEQADLLETEKGAADPRVIALALLCRSLAHLRGVFELADKDLIVEARNPYALLL